MLKLNFLNPRTGYTIIVLVVFLFMLLFGALPVVPLENDGMRMALGIQGYELYGDYAYSYRYVSQAGIYKLIRIIGKVLDFEPFYAFSVVTLVSSAFFVLFTTGFLGRLLNAKFLLSFLSLIIFQEVYVSGFYPNSSMIAAAFLSVALLLSTWKEHWGAIVLSAVFFSLAVWCRIDAILMGLAFLVLLFGLNRRSIFSILLFGTIFLGTTVVLNIVSGISLRSFIEQLSHSGGLFPDIRRTLNIYSTIFTLAAVYFMLYGIFQLLRSRSWRLICLTLLAPLPLICAYGIELDSPKKYLYGMILFAIPIVFGLEVIFSNKSRTANILLLGGLILVIGQYIFTPAYELMFSRSLVVNTSDEQRLRGAIAYTPIYWAKHRRAKLIADVTFQKKISEYLQQNEPSYLISHDWMTNQWLLYFLQNQGYRVKEAENYAAILEDGQRLLLTKGSDNVYLVRWRPETSLDLPDSLQAEVREMRSVLYIGPDYTTTDFAEKSFLSEEFESKRLPEWGRFETILFKQ